MFEKILKNIRRVQRIPGIRIPKCISVPKRILEMIVRFKNN